MRRFITILIILLSLCSEKSQATHAVGADLTYQCLGGNNYRFFFTLYRDCTGIAVSPQYTFNATSSCGDNINFQVILDSSIEVPHTCQTAITNCDNVASPIMGVEANYYHGDIILPSVCNFWSFGISPSICNRNAAITTLFPSAITYCLYVVATLNNDAVQCNNSPSFSNVPVQFLCANQVQYFVQAAYDIDGDSLTYQMITPHADALSDVQYVPGLSATQPVQYIDSTIFNSQTGDIRFHANGAQTTVVAIQINEYRNGVLIGSVERDIELIFENCTNNIPTASGINGTAFYTTHVCADSVVSFSINSSDIDAADQTYLSWDYGIPGAVFFTSGTHRDTGYFQWQPGMQDVGTQPHNFTVMVSDSACPTFGISLYSYSVYVDSCAFTTVPENNNGFVTSNAFYSFSERLISLNFKLMEATGSVISLYDIAGRRLFVRSVPKQKDYNGNIDVTSFSPGLYFLNINTDAGFTKTLKIVVE